MNMIWIGSPGTRTRIRNTSSVMTGIAPATTVRSRAEASEGRPHAGAAGGPLYPAPCRGPGAARPGEARCQPRGRAEPAGPVPRAPAAGITARRLSA